MDWFKAYREANKKHRCAMVENPRMVLNALKVSSQRSEAESLLKGPEGRWIKDITIVTHMLKRLFRDVDVVFYEKQSNFDRRLLMTGFGLAHRVVALSNALRSVDIIVPPALLLTVSS